MHVTLRCRGRQRNEMCVGRETVLLRTLDPRSAGAGAIAAIVEYEGSDIRGVEVLLDERPARDVFLVTMKDQQRRRWFPFSGHMRATQSTVSACERRLAGKGAQGVGNQATRRRARNALLSAARKIACRTMSACDSALRHLKAVGGITVPGSLA